MLGRFRGGHIYQFELRRTLTLEDIAEMIESSEGPVAIVSFLLKDKWGLLSELNTRNSPTERSLNHLYLVARNLMPTSFGKERNEMKQNIVDLAKRRCKMNVVKYSGYTEICSEATGVEESVAFVIFGVYGEANGRIARELTTSSLLGDIGVYNLGVLNSELQLQKSLNNYNLQSELRTEGCRLLITATGEAIVYPTNRYRLVSKLKKEGAQKVIGVFVDTRLNNNDYRISIQYGIKTVDSPLAKMIWRDPPSKEREEWDALYRVELITDL